MKPTLQAAPSPRKGFLVILEFLNAETMQAQKNELCEIFIVNRANSSSGSKPLKGFLAILVYPKRYKLCNTQEKETNHYSKSSFLSDFIVGFLHFIKLFAGSFYVGFIHIDQLIRVIFFNHRSVSFFDFRFSGVFFDFQDLVGIIYAFDKHRFDTSKIVNINVEITCYSLKRSYFRI